jgi:selenocysteine lyase/cysteine desulfurase/uncharacterized damage-inducible protein DinB
MIRQTAWRDRKFVFDLPIGAFLPLLERLRGTPARAKELVTGPPEYVLAKRVNDKWSVKEHLGHLLDLEPLDHRRLSEFLNHTEVLSAADMENRATEIADHRNVPTMEIIRRLTAGREALVARLEEVSEEQAGITSIHPRLKQSMRLVDWVYFVAEHDDHHLGQARTAIRTLQSETISLRRRRHLYVMRKAQIEKARDLFKIPEDVTYLNCANMAPQLKSVTEAGLGAVRTKESPWKLTAPEWFSGAETLRGLAARLLDVEADGIALVPGVSYATAVAAQNLPISSAQTIVLLDQEFPSNMYAWRELARKTGCRIRTVRRSGDTSWTEALQFGIDETTAIVAVPQCHWTDGSKVDLERIGEKVREVGAALVIDASQSLGACPLDLARVRPDFLVSVGYKWLLGPYGLGYLYVAPKWRDCGLPIEQSWLTRAGSEDFTRLVDYRDDYRPGARRFDMGEFPQFVLAPMATAALRQILAWGVNNIQEAISALTGRIVECAHEEGYAVLPAYQRCGHMIGIRHPEGIPSELTGRLQEAKVFVSIRGDSIRIAPHIYNDATDIERLFKVLRAAHAAA